MNQIQNQYEYKNFIINPIIVENGVCTLTSSADFYAGQVFYFLERMELKSNYLLPSKNFE